MTISGVQIGTVQGGVGECGSLDYPGLFIHLDNAEVWKFISALLKPEGLKGI